MTGHPAIACQGVAKSFGQTHAVRDITLSVDRGEVVAVVGPSGSGKTTFLRLLAGFEVPDSGTVSLEGKVVAGPGCWAGPEARRIGMVFQDYALFPHMSVIQNVSFGLKGWSKAARDRRASEMLGMVRLAHLAERYPHELSGGEQQRAALARALAPQPLCLLMDEPLSNLDPELRLQLRAEVKNILGSRQVPAVYVTHDQEEALFMGDRVAVINSGTLEQVDTAEDIFHSPQTRFVARFLGTADFIPTRVTENGLVTEIGVLRPLVPLPPGTGVDVMVHPDDVSVRPSGSGPGRVVRRVFRGMHYLYSLSLPSGVVVHSLQHHTVRLPEGAPVDVYLEPNQTLTCFVDRDSVSDSDIGPSFSAVT